MASWASYVHGGESGAGGESLRDPRRSIHFPCRHRTMSLTSRFNPEMGNIVMYERLRETEHTQFFNSRNCPWSFGVFIRQKRCGMVPGET